MIRVLIVDDHAILRRGLKALLSDEFHGAAFGEASNARQALEQLRKEQWDVALLDITLPGKSGLEILKEFKAARPKLPVLILSAHAEDQFAIRVLKAGAGGYMTKESAPDQSALGPICTVAKQQRPVFSAAIFSTSLSVQIDSHDPVKNRVL